MSEPRERFGLLLPMAIGDAYGAGFEFESPDVVDRENDGRRYRVRPGFTPGCYTDDTQMSLALTEVLLCGDPWTPRHLADRFVAVYHRDPRPGYARGFESVLKGCRNGSELLRRIRPGSARNGAAMRALPIGLLAGEREVRERATIQARITHDTPGGIAAAQAMALTVHYGRRRRGELAGLGVYLERVVPGYPWNAPWRGSVPLDGVATARAVVTALVNHRRRSDLLRACVAFTGDTDSVAALAVGAAGFFREYENDLAETLYRDLESGAYGREYLNALDRRLARLR